MSTYTSILVSYLMAPKLLPLINTVQELADSSDLKIAVLKFSSIDSTIFVSQRLIAFFFGNLTTIR